MKKIVYEKIALDVDCRDGSVSLPKEYQNVIDDKGVFGFKYKGFIPTSIDAFGRTTEITLIFEECLDFDSAWALAYRDVQYVSEARNSLECDYFERVIDKFSHGSAYDYLGFLPLKEDKCGRYTEIVLIFMKVFEN